MGKRSVNALTIAGFDPSGGAGVLADVKTFEQHKVTGFAVCSALTFQNESEFERVDWVPYEAIVHQLRLLFKAHRIDWVKIGLIENVDVLKKIIAFLKEENPKVKIILDPIFRASAGLDFHTQQAVAFQEVINDLYALTPNYDEAKLLTAVDEPENVLKTWATLSTAIYLKGGHRSQKIGQDQLFAEGKEYVFNPKRTDVSEKHGSGCVFSAALTAGLAKGYPLHKACLKAKQYVTKFLGSSPTLLGSHK